MHHFRHLSLIALATAALAAEPQAVEKSFASQSDFLPFFRDAHVDLYSAPGAVTLRRETLLAPGSGNKLAGGIYGSLRITPERLARKTFTLADNKNEGAEIYLFPGGAGQGSLNDVPLAFGAFPHHGGWSRAIVPASALKAGLNSLVLTDGFTLAQDRETKPVTSFLSTDGGRTWSPAEGGEFLIHLRVFRHPPQGVLTSPVVDLANPDDAPVIAPRFIPNAVEVRARSITPGHSAVRLEARTGPTPWPDETWSPWSAPEKVKPARFVQARATLAAGTGDEAPALARLTIQARGTLADSPAAHGYTLRDSRNPPLVRSSFAYAFQRPSEKLDRLRAEFKLDDLVAPGQTDLDKAVLLRNWVRRQWPCNDAGAGKRTWDALEILNAPPGERGMCVHFATVFYQAALALGFNARPVIGAGHFLAEIWSREEAKWVLMDVESIQPEGFRRYGTAHYVETPSRTPLDAFTLHQAVLRALAENNPVVPGILQLYAMDTDEGGPHTRSEAVRGPETGLGFMRSLALTPRNNYLDQLEPWEEMHGENHYHSDDYLWWRVTAPVERDAQYSRRSDREGDFQWTVHQVRLHPTVTDTPGVLTVLADTVTPNLAEFRFAPGGAPPVTLPGNGADPDSRRAAFTWRLQPGVNTLAVTAVNRFQRAGRSATLSVVWSPPAQPEKSPP